MPPTPDSHPRSHLGALAEDGFVAGVVGGASVAVFFLIVDALGGRPLFTPSLLGSVFLLGKDPQSLVSVDMRMVVAYTGIHMLVFVAIGLVAAWAVQQFEERPHVGVVLVILFACFEASFLGLTAAFMPGVIGVLGAWLVGTANLLSAVAMATYLLWWSHPNAVRSLERVWEDAG